MGQKHVPIDDALLARLPAPRTGHNAEEEAKPIAAKVVVARKGSVPEVLEALAAVAARDQRAESLRPLLLGAALVALAGALWAFTSKTNVNLGFAAGGVAVTFFLARYLIGDNDVSDRQLAATCTLLTTLASELRAGEPVSMKINFSGWTRTFPRRSEGRKIYARDWLKLRLPLADGTQASVAIRGVVKRKTRLLRKHVKHTDQLTERLTITFTPPQGATFAIQTEPKVPRVAGLKLVRSEVKARRASFVFRTRVPLRRQRVHGGWALVKPGELLDGETLLSAFRQSHRAAKDATAG